MLYTTQTRLVFKEKIIIFSSKREDIIFNKSFAQGLVSLEFVCDNGSYFVYIDVPFLEKISNNV